ncbi:hypothetical protein GIB67_036646 [Kingdonia uniflora]|uniref:Uncharacterized protein n=1 Tax=Kingdonia uniflora TaxID=39325 RepID=A0A7J7LWF7_9MAGN|nr:hypothetical protein GIB67_036646 [Kingdonia uniflora]
MMIEELDEKKETLKVTWVKVNTYFGSIFSTLLPGTMAILEPPEGCTFLDGLDISLLLFKPAPLYIRDEVLLFSIPDIKLFQMYHANFKIIEIFAKEHVHYIDIYLIWMTA